MKKVLFLTICAGLLFVSNNFAQVCGGSFLHLQMIDAENGKTIENANYRLFYVYPKTAGRPDDKEVVNFAARFYYGESDKDRGYFYKIYDKTNFLQVDADKAEDYIKNYNAEDYKNSSNPWKEDHEKQLSGVSTYGKLTFRASEMDDTPFLLKIEANGFAPVYLFSNFLGGCYHGATYKIEMKPAVAKPLYKCLPDDKEQIKLKIEKFPKRR